MAQWGFAGGFGSARSVLDSTESTALAESLGAPWEGRGRQPRTEEGWRWFGGLLVMPLGTRNNETVQKPKGTSSSEQFVLEWEQFERFSVLFRER